MSDPIGLVNSGGVGNGAGGVLGPRGSAGAPAPANGTGTEAGPASFKDVLMNTIEDVNRLQQEAETAIEDVATGRRDDVEGVLLAAQKADVAFRTLLAVRNKVQGAFDEIKQMRV